MAFPVEGSVAESDFFIPLAPGETKADRLAEIREEADSRQRIDPAHANMRGYVWAYTPPRSARDFQEHVFRITGANGQEYLAVSEEAELPAMKAAYALGALVTFSANSRKVVLQTHSSVPPAQARIVDYDLGQRAWIAEDKENGRRIRFSTRQGGAYVHSFNGTPGLGVTVSYHAGKHDQPCGVLVQEVPRPLEAWRHAAFKVRAIGCIPLLFLSAGLQVAGCKKLANVVLGDGAALKAPLPVSFPPAP